jgi:tetratricopeptide (TPR) repeat protein
MTRLLPIFLVAAGLAPAQMNMAGHGTAGQGMAGQGMETQDETPPEELPAPRKLSGIGNSHIQITATPEVQAWFDQGLNLLHDFWDYESARAFEQSVRVDPKCAMCYWGLYKAESFYHSTAKGYAAQALAKAVSLKNNASAREQLYIEATATHEDATKIWRKLVSEYPQETQARIFLAQAARGNEGAAMLEAVLKEFPQDSAANHYYIHDMEPTDHPERALPSAEILASLAPTSGHMVHMPGHIFFRVGDYARADQSFAAAVQADERYMQEQHIQPDNDWNYVHNLMYAIANLLEEGKMKEATALSMKVNGARGKLETTLYTNSARDSISRLDPQLPVALRTADWVQVNERLQASAPARRPNLEFLAKELAGYAAGMHAVETHELGKAEEAAAGFDAELKQMSGRANGSSGMRAPVGGRPQLEVMPDALLQPLLKTLAVMSLELRASLLAVENKGSDAEGMFLKAGQEEEALGYHEPPNYIRPVGETEGAAMMAIGDWKAAKAAYERALRERPKSGLALYGIALSSEKLGDGQAAAKEYAEFLKAWKSADADLPQLKHAREYVASASPH